MREHVFVHKVPSRVMSGFAMTANPTIKSDNTMVIVAIIK